MWDKYNLHFNQISLLVAINFAFGGDALTVGGYTLAIPPLKEA